MTQTEILSRLDGVKGQGDQYSAKCPAHDDKRQSLSISVGDDGRILFNCHAGCTVEDITAAMGITTKDLFPDDEAPQKKTVVAEYQYYDLNGHETVKKVRYSDKSFVWRRQENGKAVYNRRGIQPSLYGIGASGLAALPQSVLLLEGEKDVETLKALGKAAVSLPDGAKSKWYSQYTDALRGRYVSIIQDNDPPGKEFAQRVAAELHGEAKAVRVLDLTKIWPEVPEHGDTTDLINYMGPEAGWAAIVQLVKDTPEWEPSELSNYSNLSSSPPECANNAFEPFEPFEPPDTSRLPKFPVECLPTVLRDMAETVAGNLQVAVDMPAVAVLAVISLCVQSKFIINPKPGWVEPLNLYVTIVALPSERKTPMLAAITKPVYAFEKEENDRRRPAIEEYTMKHNVLTKRISNMMELAAKPQGGKSKPVSMSDLTELRWELDDLEREQVKPLRLLADDTTPEALISRMSENGGKMAVVSSEGGIFDIIAGRYSSNGKANMDIFLKGYSGDYLRIDRQGRPSETIEHPTLTMLLTVQPVVLEAIMGNQEFAGRGFLSRPLYSFPVSMIGARSYETTQIPPQVEEAYKLLLNTLLSIPDLGESRVIKVDHDAHTEAKRFFESLEPRLIDDLDELEGWAGKYHGQIMRIAGLLHCCIHGKDAATVPLTGETMRNAQTIGEYFLAHAKAAFQIMGLTDDQDTKDAKYILRRLKDFGETEISKRDLYQLVNGRFSTVETMDSGLNVLIQRGYVCLEKIKTGGRPTEKIMLNTKVQKVQ